VFSEWIFFHCVIAGNFFDFFYQTSAASGFIFLFTSCSSLIVRGQFSIKLNIPISNLFASCSTIVQSLLLFSGQYFLESNGIQIAIHLSTTCLNKETVLSKSRQNTVSVNYSAKFHLFSLSKSLSEELISSKWFKVFHDSDFSSIFLGAWGVHHSRVNIQLPLKCCFTEFHEDLKSLTLYDEVFLAFSVTSDPILRFTNPGSCWKTNRYRWFSHSRITDLWCSCLRSSQTFNPISE
jgi:hypothetical protein